MSEPIQLADLSVEGPGSVHNMQPRAGTQVQRPADTAALIGASEVIVASVKSSDAKVREPDAGGLCQPRSEHVHPDHHLPDSWLGTQPSASGCDEGELPGFGLIPGRARCFRFDEDPTHPKAPQKGWKVTTPLKAEPLTRGLEQGARFHFVRWHWFECAEPAEVLLHTVWDIAFASEGQRGTVTDAQFNREKSRRFGMQLLQNFVEV